MREFLLGSPLKLEPPSPQAEGQPKKIVLFYSDIGGTMSINNQLLQDCFAENGYLVLGIDYLFGDSVQLHMEEPNFDIMTWATGKRDVVVQGNVAGKWLKGVKEIYGKDAKYCCVGYCFGGPFVLELAGTDEVIASAFAHPASLNEDHIKNVTKPLLMCCAEDDFTFPTKSRRRAEDLLVAAKAVYHVQVFSGVSHGFGTRADLAIENQRWAKEESVRSIVGWFNRFSY